MPIAVSSRTMTKQKPSSDPSRVARGRCSGFRGRHGKIRYFPWFSLGWASCRGTLRLRLAPPDGAPQPGTAPGDCKRCTSSRPVARHCHGRHLAAAAPTTPAWQSLMKATMRDAGAHPEISERLNLPPHAWLEKTHPMT
ncbi:hypothetical protein CLJ1_1882 [Pseudomonas paraeruginosa]|nr:hypothetical protein CLJ1_1882 [Pseudomonas aeruginosa]